MGNSTLAKLKKLIATLSLSTLVASLLVVPTAGAHFADDAYSRLGDGSDKSFDRVVNKCEFMAMLVRTFDLEEETIDHDFVDVPSWCEPYVGPTVNGGIVTGEDSTHLGMPRAMNRTELITMTVRAMGLTPEAPDAKYAAELAPVKSWGGDEYWGAALAAGLVDDDGKLDFNASAYRGEAFVVADRAGGNGGGGTVTPPSTVDGDLTLKESALNPAGADVNNQAVSVPVMAFELQSNDGTVDVDSITIQQSGSASLPTTTEFYLYDETGRLTTGRTLNKNSDTGKTVTFRGLNMEVGESAKTVWVRMTLGDVGTATGTFQLAVSEVVSNAASVGGTAKSNTFSVNTTSVGTLTINKNGTPSDPTVGESGATLAKFQATASNTESVYIDELGLYVSGTINVDDIVDAELYVSGETDPIATVSAANSSDVLSFVLDTPYKIPLGESRTFTMTADLNTGRTNDTIRIYVDEAVDVRTHGSIYGWGNIIDIDDSDGYDGSTCTTNGNDCSSVTVQGGDVTMWTNGPAATDIPTNGKDITLMNLGMSTLADVEFRSFEIYLTASESADTTEGLMSSATVPNFTDIKLVDNETGETLLGPIDADAMYQATNNGTGVIGETDTVGYYKFSDTFELLAAEPRDLSLKTDIASLSTIDGMTISAAVTVNSSIPEIRDSNNQAVTNASSLVPSSSFSGKTHTVSSPSLSIGVNSTPVTQQTYVKGAKDVKFVGLTMACGQASECKVTDMTLQGYLDDSGTANDWTIDGVGDDHATYLNEYVTSVWLVGLDTDGSETTVASAKGVQTNGTVVFDQASFGGGWTIGAGKTKVLYVVGDISNDAYKNSDGEDIAFGISSTSNVTVEDKDGSTFTVTGTPNSGGADATAPDVYLTTSAGGSLTIAVGSGTPKEDIAIAGTTDMLVSTFKFTSTDEAFTVEELALQNRQSGVSTASLLGNYDNNVTRLRLEYEDEDGNTVGDDYVFLDSGNGTVDGLSMYVPKDDDATLKVYADLTTVANGATSASGASREYVDINLAFNNFKALSVDSGTSYRGDKIDNDTAAASDLDFGTISWTDSGYDTEDPADGGAAQTITAAGTTTSLNVDTGSLVFPVGTLLLVEESGTTCTYAALEDWIFVTTADWDTSGDSTNTLLVLDDGTEALAVADLTIPDGSNVCYSLPGTGYLTGTNQMHVHETKPTFSLNTNSPSGNGHTPTANDEPFIFNISANAQEEVQIRTGMVGPDDTDPVVQDAQDADVEITTTAGEFVDGTGAIEITYDEAAGVDGATEYGNAGDCFLVDDDGSASANYTAGSTEGTLGFHQYLSFWINSSEVDVTYDTLDVVFDTNNDCDDGTGDTVLNLAPASATIYENGTQITSNSEIIGDGTADIWTLVTVDISGSVDSSDVNFGFSPAAGTGAFASGDQLRIDGIVLHNEMLAMDITSDADFETDDVSVTLKENGSTVASAGVGYRSASDSGVMFVPIYGTNTAIEIPKGGSKTFSVQLDTDDLLSQDPGSDDPLRFQVALGSSSGGTVTPGDFWWYDTNTTVQWLGQTSTSTFSSNSVGY